MRTCGQTITPGLIYYCDQCSKGNPCVEPGPHVAVCNQLRKELHDFKGAATNDIAALVDKIKELQGEIRRIDASGQKLADEVNDNFDRITTHFRRGR